MLEECLGVLWTGVAGAVGYTGSRRGPPEDDAKTAGYTVSTFDVLSSDK